MARSNLTSIQREVVRQIQRLKKEREALNITAVKRHYPDLIEKVYSVKPFWGWKRALEDAGLDYSKIRIELEEFCECQFCGERFKILSNHITSKHESDREDYCARFPGAETCSEELRAKWRNDRFNGGSTFLRHWEPIWSPEYLLDKIHAYRQRGIPLNSRHIGMKEGPLVAHAIEFFGGWDNALKKVGLNPSEIRRKKPTVHYTPQSLIEELRFLRKKRIPLNSTALIREDRTSLMVAARKYFGSYSEALKKAGIAPGSVMLKIPKYLDEDRQRLLEATREMARVPLEDPSRKKLILRFQKRFLPLTVAFYDQSWLKVAEAAGVDCNRIRIRRYRDFSTKERVIEHLRQRLKLGQPITASAVGKSDPALYWAVRRHFANYYDFYSALGLPKPMIQTNPSTQRR